MGKRFFSNIAIIFAISILLVLIYHCKNPKTESDYYTPPFLATHSNGANFVGSETCTECHVDIYASHQKTAHFNTSAQANEKNIQGSFEEGSNVLDLEYVRFTMKRERDSFFQYSKIKNRNVKEVSSSFDLTIGSGVRGQSYGTWEENKLFQLQTSYHTPTDSWVNSPGFSNYVGKDRPIRAACLKCHVTFAENASNVQESNQYEKTSILYGIDCERCHGPSEKHVVSHRKNPEAKTAKFMLSLDSLTQQQRLDVCAQCHSGSRNRLIKGNSFSFLSGEVLDEYAQNSRKNKLNEKPDVHGNQYGLLIGSKCFKQTANMDCTTCHNPHRNQRGDTAYFNQKCMQCHSNENVVCDVEEGKMKAMGNNCIACHMPVSPSDIMKVQLNETDSLETSFYIRSHHIGIYEEK